MDKFTNNVEVSAQTLEGSIVELNDLQLALVGGGIGDTILVNPTK